MVLSNIKLGCRGLRATLASGVTGAHNNTHRNDVDPDVDDEDHHHDSGAADDDDAHAGDGSDADDHDATDADGEDNNSDAHEDTDDVDAHTSDDAQNVFTKLRLIFQGDVRC